MLNVAEKPSVAKEVATILSGNNFVRVRGASFTCIAVSVGVWVMWLTAGAAHRELW